MFTRLLFVPALLIVTVAIPSSAQDWRSPGFKFPQPVQIVAEVPVKETKGDPDGLPTPPRRGRGIIGVIEEDVTGAMARGTALGSVTSSRGERLSCVVANSREEAKAIIRVIINSRLGMRGYRVQGSNIEFRAGFENRPRIQYEGNLPEACKQRFREEAEKDLDRLMNELERPAGSMSVSEVFDKGEKGVPGRLDVPLTFLGTKTTASLTFPMPRPFGQ